RPFAAEIRAAGVPLVCQVQFLSQIDNALDAGSVAIVAQGTEAGGHSATRSTLPFVPEAADYLKSHSPETLLLAAGGTPPARGWGEGGGGGMGRRGDAGCGRSRRRNASVGVRRSVDSRVAHRQSHSNERRRHRSNESPRSASWSAVAQGVLVSLLKKQIVRRV